MKRLKYWQKFLLIGTLFLLPIIQTEYLLFSSIVKDIRFVQNERLGIAYTNHIRHLLEALQQHRGAVNAYLSGDRSFQDNIVWQQTRIEKTIIEIDKVDQIHGSSFHTTAQWETIKDKWFTLKSSLSHLQPQESVIMNSDIIKESFELHTSIVSDLLVVIGNIKDWSGLKVDPERNSYYLIDTLITKLPSIIETIGQTRGIGVGIAAKKAVTEEEKTQLIILSGIIRSSMNGLADIPDDFGNSKLNEELAVHIQDNIVETTSFLKYLSNQMIDTNRITVQPSEFFERATKVIDSGFKLYDSESPVLDQLLQERMHQLNAKKDFLTLFSIIIILLLLYLFVAFNVSVLQTVLALKKAAIRIVGGDLTARLDVDSKDELGQVAMAFNKMIDAFDGMISERTRHEKQIERLAFYDALTGLPNRVLFNDRLELAIATAEECRQTFAVMYLDLDRFKHINDTLGHNVGDLLLKKVADRLRECLWEDDTISRIGGDEFLLIIPRINGTEAVSKVAEKMINRFSEPVVINGHELVVSVSIGISMYPFDGNNREVLMKNADTAMYYAKDEGRNNFQIYSSEMNDLSDKRLHMEVNLRRALERNEFMVYYQPRITLLDGKISGMEALVRWQRPDVGLVPPGEFIPLAEEIGLIVPLGEWILRMACNQIKQWQTSGIDPIRISVNISAVQFHRAGFVEVVKRALNESSLEPKWLELELTESIVMNNVTKSIKKLVELKDVGVHISIDDFGTGFSSLSYLKHFPIDTLKIDRSFIQDIPESAKDIAIVKTIIALGRRLHLNVVAEGVETKEQYTFLTSRKCNEGQGYFISRPLPAEEITGLLRKPMISFYNEAATTKEDA